MKLQHLFLPTIIVIINHAVSAELSAHAVHAWQGTNSDVGANPNVAPNVAPFQPEAKPEPIRQEEKAINGTQSTNSTKPTNQTTNQTNQTNQAPQTADPVHNRRHHRPAQRPAHHQAGARPAHQPPHYPPRQQHAVRHPAARPPYYYRQPSIRRFLIYGRPHNRPDLPLVLIYPRTNGNYSRNTLAMFKAISESPNKPILGLNIIPFLGMNLISEVLGLDLTLIPEHKNDLDQVEDDSIHFPSDMNKDQLLRLLELHGMVPMPKDDDEDSDEVQKGRLVLMGQQAVPEYHPSAPNSGNRGMLQLMSNYNRPRDDESVPRIQPRSLGILAKFHPRFNIKNEGDLEISEVNRKRRSADEEKQEDKSSTTTSTTESSSSNSSSESSKTSTTTSTTESSSSNSSSESSKTTTSTTESSSSTTEPDSKHSNSSSESSESKHSESSNKETESSEESSESKESSENNSTTESSNSNSTTTADETHKTVSQILEQLLVEVIEFLFH